jgi:hypothetical protein
MQQRTKRQMSDAVEANRAVRRAFQESLHGLTALQREGAYLRALAEKDRADGDLVTRSATLRAQAAVARESIERVIGTLPPARREHSRVIDTLRSLDSIVSGIPK